MKVSVIIPTHNRAKLLERAIKSVLEQTYANFEIIVVSDGSTDETDLIMQKYKNQDARIKYISYYPAKGANHARNIGIKAAEGEYIAFLDDDDEWMPKKLELQIQEFVKNDRIGLVYTGIQIIYHRDNGKDIMYYSLPKKRGNLSKDILINNWIGTTSSVIIKKTIFEKVGGFDETLKALQDYDLWIRVCQVAEVGAVSEPLVRYHNYSWSKQISSDINKYEESVDLIKMKYANYFKNDKDLLKQHEMRFYIVLAQKALRNNNPQMARKYLRRCFRFDFNFKIIAMYCISFLKYDIILKLRSLKN